MAAGKKSFVLYSDLLVSIGHLTNEEKGILFNHLLEYVNDKNPILEDRLLLTAWKPIEMQLKRDLIKFENVRVKRSEAGKKSAEIKAQQNSTKSTLVDFVQHRSTKSTDNVNDNVNVNDNDNVNVNEIKEKDIPTQSDVIVDVKKLEYQEKLKDFDLQCEKMLVYYNHTFEKQNKVVNQKVKDKLKKVLFEYNWEDIAKAMREVKKSQHHSENGYRWATLEFFTRPEKLDMYAFTSTAKTEYTGEDAGLVNHVNKYLKAVQS